MPPSSCSLLVAENRNLGGENLGLGHLDGCLSDQLLAWIVEDLVDRPPGSFEQSLGGVQLDLEITDLRDCEDVLVPCSWRLSI